MSSLTPVALACEYLEHPLAIERPDPRLSWRSDSAARGARQTAYRVVVAKTGADLLAGRSLLWDSGRIESDASAHIHYAGTPLASFQRAAWRVQVWDETGVASPWSAVAGWAMGILKREEWRGQWIHSPAQVSSNSPYFRRSFSLDKPVTDARLYATARGIFLAWINGRPVSDEQFAPGWTDYAKRLLYRCHDVTALVNDSGAAGERVLSAQINDGWYKGPVGWEGKAHIWGGRCELLMLLRLEHADGTVTWIVSDDQWRTANSPVLSSTFLKGELYDGGAEPIGWDRAGFDAKGWHKVNATAIGDAPILQAHQGPPVRRLSEVKPVARWQARPGSWIFDLGENIAGRVRIRLRAPAGTTIRLRHGEMVTPDRQLYVDNLRTATSIDVFTAAGTGEEIWEPRFTFHGFQYVEVAGWPGEPPLDAITGIVLGSDCPAAGSFTCSDPMIDKLYGNIVRTQRANYLEVPTDCPQRDERLGWTGDAQAYIRTAICSRDIAAFFTKWLQDLRDAQNADGTFPNIAPQVPGLGGVWGLERGDAAWADAGTICPLTMWRCYADKDILAAMFPAMVKWVEYCDRTAIEGINIRYHRDKQFIVFGDWLQVDCWTPPEVIMTAFYAHGAKLVAEAAEVLGKQAEATRFRELHEKVKKAFQREFVKADGTILGKRTDDETQTIYLLALHFDLVPAALRAAAVEKLVACIAARDWHLSTGFVGLPYLLPVLSANGRTDVAYRLLNTTTYPSWLYPITQGATTIWERWNGWKKEEGPADPGMNSYSHYAYGACGEWLFSDVAGIDLLEPGFKRMRIRPRIGGGLTRAEATHRCIHGEIRSSWTHAQGALTLVVTVPPNTSAEIWIPTSDTASLREAGKPWPTPARHEPGYAVIETGAGTYVFTAAFSTTAATTSAKSASAK